MTGGFVGRRSNFARDGPVTPWVLFAKTGPASTATYRTALSIRDCCGADRPARMADGFLTRAPSGSLRWI